MLIVLLAVIGLIVINAVLRPATSQARQVDESYRIEHGSAFSDPTASNRF